jgi:hypothetical protein
MASAPAAMFLYASLKIASARTVAVVVPSPATFEVVKLDFFGDCYAVFGYGWPAPAFIQDGVSASWAKGWFDCCCQFFYTGQQRSPCIRFKCQLFNCHDCFSPNKKGRLVTFTCNYRLTSKRYTSLTEDEEPLCPC